MSITNLVYCGGITGGIALTQGMTGLIATSNPFYCGGITNTLSQGSWTPTGSLILTGLNATLGQEFSISNNILENNEQEIPVPYFDENFEETSYKKEISNDDKSILIKAASEWEQCSICCENKRDYLYLPCRHITNCWKCANNILNDTKKCPICREKIEKSMRVFL